MRRTDEERRELILDAKAFYLAAPLIMPVIEARKRAALHRLISEYRNGNTDLIAFVAELASFETLEMEFKTKEATFRSLDAGTQEKK